MFSFIFLWMQVPADSVSPNDTVRMIFAGDVTLGHRFQQWVGNDTTYAFKKWKLAKPVDVFMVNLENPVTNAQVKIEKEYNFKMRPLHVGTLKNGGINIVTVANNHAHDYGAEGILETIRTLDSAGIARVGIGRNLEEARRPKIFSIKGKRIGFLGYAGWIFPATKTKPGVAFRSIDVIRQDIKKLRPSVDVIIVNFHWGKELEESASPDQVFLGRSTIDAGADVVIGHHPHVLQGIEVYNGKTIAYSLGNFIFGGNALHTYETAALSVEIIGNELKTSIVPVSVKKYQPMVAAGKAKRMTMELVSHRSRQFKKTISFTQE